MFGANQLTLPWPIATLLLLAGLIASLGSALALLRASSVRANLELLRTERDDYRAALDHSREERKEEREEAAAERHEMQERFERQQLDCTKKIQVLEVGMATLKETTSGAIAVKELGDLLVTIQAQGKTEVLGAIRAVGSEFKTAIESLMKERHEQG